MPKGINDYKKEIEQLISALGKIRQEAKSTQNVFDILSNTLRETGFASDFTQQQLDNLTSRINMSSAAAAGFERRLEAVKTQLRDLTSLMPQLQAGTLRSMPMLPARQPMGYLTAGAEPQPMITPDPRAMYRGTGYIPPQLMAGRRAVGRDPADIMDRALEDPPMAGARGEGGDYDVGRIRSITQAWNEAHLAQAKLYTQNEFPKVMEAVKKYGMSVDNLKKVHNEAATQIKTFTFAQQGANGVMNTATVTTDRWGNVLKDTQKRFRGFFSTIGRNIQEAIKWSIAIQLVWGPLKKVGELVEIAIQNEAKLADITISLGEAQSEVNEIFKTAADVAEETGESVHGVLQGYELAIRATGGIKNENERLATSQILLRDSMVLSKLSSLEQAQALDTLVGATRQLSLDLDEGIQLIDSWIAVGKRANVSVETLAESFAITAASASNARLSLHELNGIITVVAENTTLSATEAGNAVRAFISGFQTDKAQKELAQFGVAVKTTSGDALGFYDVMQQISDLYQTGIITDAQLNKIGEAIGGGARRGAQVVATIKDLARVQEVAEVSAKAHGDAEEALGIKLDTVQTKLTEVANAFQKLAQSLGEDGGILDILKVLLDTGEGLIDTFTALSKLLGSALPVIVATSIALARVGKTGGFASLTGGMATTAAGLGGGAGLTRGALRGGAALTRTTGFGVPAIAATAGINLLQGENEQAIGSAIGGAFGLAAGAAFGPQAATIGALVGASIGESFVSNVLEYEYEFENLFANVFPTEEGGAIEKGAETFGEALKREQQDLFDDLLSQAGGGNEALGRFKSAVIQSISSAYAALPWTEQEQGLTREQATLVAARGLGGRFGESDISNYLSRTRQLQQLGETDVSDVEALSTDQSRLADDYASTIEDITSNLRDEVREQRTLNQITNKQYNDSKNAIEGLKANLTGLYTLIGDLNAAPSEIAASFRDMADTLIYASEEERTAINELSGDITQWMNLLEQAEEAGGEIDFGGVLYTTSEIRENIEIATEILRNYIDLIGRSTAISRVSIPSVSEQEGITPRQLDNIIQQAKAKFSREFAAGTREGLYEGVEESDLSSQFESFFVDLGPKFGLVLVNGVRQSDLDKVIAEQIEAGTLAGMDNIGLRDFTDFTKSQVLSTVAQANQIQQAIEGEFGIDLDEQTFIAWTSNAITGPITANQFIMQMLMKDLIDVNEKQLEGVYNLPTDASFYVPFTGYALGQGGAGGGLNVEQLINALDNLTNAVNEETTSRGSYGRVARGEVSERIARAESKSADIPALTEIAKSVEEQREAAMELYRYSSLLSKDEEKTTRETINEGIIEAMERNSEVNFEILNLLRNPIEFFKGLFFGGEDVQDQSGDFKSLDKAIDALNKSRSETSLKLDINSSTVLQLDGQVVAEVVKNYLYEDLIKQEDTSTSVSRSVVI